MKISIFFISLFLSLTAFAQDYDFGEVSKEELEEKYNSLDSSASATYLYKNRKSYFEYNKVLGFQLITNIHERIKIYNAEGFKYATPLISLYKDNSEREKIKNINAYTYNLIDGKIVDNKIKKDAIFDTERNTFFNETTFTLPNIKEGSVIEYEYTIVSPFFWNVNEFQFQHEIPIKKLDAVFEAPEYYNFKVNYKGFLQITPVNEVKADRIIHTKNYNATGGTRLNSGAKTKIVTYTETFDKNVATFNLVNIPALKEEPFVNNIDNYRSSAKYELSYTKFWTGALKYYSTTWEDVVKTIYNSSDFGNELDRTGYYEDEVDALITNEKDTLNRISLIYDFVKSKVKWNGYYSKYTNDGVRKAFKEHTGNVAEINLMLISMLRYVGIDSNPVLVSTRRNGIPLFPTLLGYNYVIASVNVSNKTVLLDATSKYSNINVLPFRALNWEGRIIKKNETSSLISLYPKEKSKNTIRMMVELDKDGTINGGYRNTHTSHDALIFRENYNEVNKDDFLKKLENKYNGLEISDYKVKNDSDFSKPVVESYKFVNESQTDIIGDKLYFSPLFFLKTVENPFKLEKREFPVDFGYASESSYRIIINIPDGYKIESLPKAEAVMLLDNLGGYKYNISGSGNTIQLAFDIEMNQPIISPRYYNDLKAYFIKLINKQAEQIVLTKV
jgi:hypothetical protein